MAVPVGSRRARSQREWLACALAAIEAAGWRRDRAANFAAVCAVLAAYMDWSAGTARPTWRVLSEAAGATPGRPLSRATVARCLAWLSDIGLLGVVEHGSTGQLRPRPRGRCTVAGPGAPGCAVPYVFTGDGNRAAVYVLTIRRKRQPSRAPVGECGGIDTPSWSSLGPCKGPRTREAPAGGLPQSTTQAAAPDLAVCRALAAHSRLSPLSRLSARYLRHLTGDFLAGGWTGRDVLHAIDYRPDGSAWSYTASVRHPAGWIRTRLGAWRADDGSPVPSLSQRSHCAHQQLRAEQARRRREAETAAARRVDPATSAGRAAARSSAEQGRRNHAQRAPMAAHTARPGSAAAARRANEPPRAPRPAIRHLRPVPPPQPQDLTVAGLARILLVVRDPAARAAISADFFRARATGSGSIPTASSASTGRADR